MDNMHKRLKETRTALNMNQYEIAAKLGIKQPLWNRWENGKAEISSKNLYHVCKTLGISADWLLGLSDEP